MTLHISSKIHMQLKIYAAKKGKNMQELAEKIISEYLEKQN